MVSSDMQNVTSAERSTCVKFYRTWVNFLPDCTIFVVNPISFHNFALFWGKRSGKCREIDFLCIFGQLLVYLRVFY